MVISFWHRLLDLISPRLCVVCGNRLTVTEETICSRCNFHLPRTGFGKAPYDNEMAKLFWAQIPIERAAALFYYEAHSETANIIYMLKYKNHWNRWNRANPTGKEATPSAWLQPKHGDCQGYL